MSTPNGPKKYPSAISGNETESFFNISYFTNPLNDTTNSKIRAAKVSTANTRNPATCPHVYSPETAHPSGSSCDAKPYTNAAENRIALTVEERFKIPKEYFHANYNGNNI